LFIFFIFNTNISPIHPETESPNFILSPDRDTFISQDNPTTDHGSLPLLEMGNKSGSKYYMLLYFNLDKYIGISNFKLSFNRAIPQIAFRLDFYLITSPWNESVTWDTQPSFLPEVIESISCQADQSSCSTGLFTFIESWLTGTTNYGILLKDDSADYNISFASKEGTPGFRDIEISFSYDHIEEPDEPVLIPHESIRIENDSAFNLYELPGRGTLNDPYRIEKLNITTLNDRAIFIAQTSKSFVIKDCFITAQEFGIYLYKVNSTGVKIVNNIILNHGFDGIHIDESPSVEISGNKISQNIQEGIFIASSNGITINENIIKENGFSGIHLLWSNLSMIFENEFSRHNFSGSYFVNLETLQFSNNNVSNNENGFVGESVISSNVTNNIFKKNDYYGVTMDDNCSNNVLAANLFIENNQNVLDASSQAKDDGTDNKWFNHLNQGNNWTDWIGSGSYLVDGSAGNLDLYPSFVELDDISLTGTLTETKTEILTETTELLLTTTVAFPIIGLFALVAVSFKRRR
jgi:parallel beta-helix repeat protein